MVTSVMRADVVSHGHKVILPTILAACFRGERCRQVSCPLGRATGDEAYSMEGSDA